MDGSFFRSEESGADPRAGGSEGEHGRETSPISDASCRHDRGRSNRIDHARDQAKGSHLSAHMSACLPALRHNDVHSSLDGLPRIGGVWRRMEDHRSSLVNASDQRGRIAPEQGDDRNTFLKTGSQSLLLIKSQVQIDPERPLRQRLRLTDLAAEPIEVNEPEGQHSEPAGIAHGCRKLWATRPAHGGLDDRNVDSKCVAQSGPHPDLLSPLGERRATRCGLLAGAGPPGWCLLPPVIEHIAERRHKAELPE